MNFLQDYNKSDEIWVKFIEISEPKIDSRGLEK